MNRIRDCPFCASEEIIFNSCNDEKRDKIFFIECSWCGAKGPWLYFDEPCEDNQKFEQCLEIWKMRLN